jgi:hypothetical protein
MALWEEECVTVLHDYAFNMEFLANRQHLLVSLEIITG